MVDTLKENLNTNGLWDSFMIMNNDESYRISQHDVTQPNTYGWFWRNTGKQNSNTKVNEQTINKVHSKPTNTLVKHFSFHL